MVVCHCAAINDSAIARLRSEGATVGDIIAACGAGGDCGGCIPIIEDLLERDDELVDVAVAVV
jgi:bacterioferritin-associated ferredoxin